MFAIDSRPAICTNSKCEALSPKPAGLRRIALVSGQIFEFGFGEQHAVKHIRLAENVAFEYYPGWRVIRFDPVFLGETSPFLCE